MNILRHQVTCAAREDEECLSALLGVSAKQFFSVSLCVECYLLKFVDGDDTRTVFFFEIAEYLAECRLWLLNVAKPDVECRVACRGIKFEAHAQ